VESPRAIVEERHGGIGTEAGVPGGVAEGVLGGIPGGIPGGVIGGVVGGVVGGVPGIEVPPPPPPPVKREPIRVGGAVKAPALLERVEPDYPGIAVRARVQGVVILEAVVDREGRIEDVRVLRSIPLLDRAAIAAVRQWRYSPLLVSGQPESFVLTVTVRFSLAEDGL
jgi:periplasmic protein TonB